MRTLSTIVIFIVCTAFLLQFSSDAVFVRQKSLRCSLKSEKIQKKSQEKFLKGSRANTTFGLNTPMRNNSIRKAITDTQNAWMSGNFPLTLGTYFANFEQCLVYTDLFYIDCNTNDIWWPFPGPHTSTREALKYVEITRAGFEPATSRYGVFCSSFWTTLFSTILGKLRNRSRLIII